MPSIADTHAAAGFTLCPVRVEIDSDHIYWREGRPVPGVTTILKVRQLPWLAPWKVKVAKLEAVRMITGARIEEDRGQIQRVEYGRGYDIEPRCAFRTYAEWVEHVWAGLTAAAKVSDVIARQAMDTGHDLHASLEWYVKERIEGRQPQDLANLVPPEFSLAAIQFLEWEAREDVEWLYSERRVFCEKEWYAGTLDFVACLRRSGMTVLGDFKSCKKFQKSDEWSLQTAAYQLAVGEEAGCEDAVSAVSCRLILMFDKLGSGMRPYVIPSRFDYDAAAFLACRTLYRWNSYLEELTNERSA